MKFLECFYILPLASLLMISVKVILKAFTPRVKENKKSHTFMSSYA